MAFRLVPEKRRANDEFIEPNILKANLTEPVGYKMCIRDRDLMLLCAI